MIVRTTAVTALVFLGIACGSRDLTRQQAQELIEQHQEFALEQELTATEEAARRAIDEHLLEKRPFEGFGTMVDRSTGSGPYRVSVKGLKVFKVVDLYRFTLQQPIHRKVSEVTGITEDASGTKVATFLWHFSDLSVTLNRYTGVTTADHEGQALFRRYDDGWRVETVELSKNMYGGGNPRPLGEELLKPLELIGNFEGTITDTGASPRPVFVQVIRDSAPDQVFGFFMFTNPSGGRQGQKFDGTWDKRSGNLLAVARMYGTTYTLRLTGDTLTGTGAGAILDMRRQPPGDYNPTFFTKAEWDNAYGYN